MNLIKNLIGIFLVYISFFNPLNLEFIFRIILFIIGFDLMSFLPKISIFLFDYFFGFTGLGILLIFLIFADILSKVIFSGLAFLAKPIIIFLLLYFVMPDFAISLATAAINFLINLGLFKL